MLPVKIVNNMIIDDIKITVKAGNGGDGLATFSKTKMTLGPTGGSGGNGGSIYIEGVSDLSALRQFRFKKEIKAESGQGGRAQLSDGPDGKDLILYVPVGTIASLKQINSAILRGRTVEIKKIGQRELIAKGGRGGKGNYLFRSAVYTSPKKYEEGKPGENFEIRFELKMIADVGFIGLPNVGKSSLLNEITNAKSKVANYPFTTLEPNLGVYFELILADIPGLIEGASEGKGLGTKFLRHIERTKILFHFVSAESKDPVSDYKTVRGELESYSPLLAEKPEHIFISKSDTVSAQEIKGIINEFKKIKIEATPVSIIDEESLTSFKKILNQLISEKQA